MRGATAKPQQPPAAKAISIHAPHEGCDSRTQELTHIRFGFQSTHPMRGATADYLERGGDPEFQSTHPMRGATPYQRDLVDNIHFNPRTP